MVLLSKKHPLTKRQLTFLQVHILRERRKEAEGTYGCRSSHDFGSRCVSHVMYTTAPFNSAYVMSNFYEYQLSDIYVQILQTSDIIPLLHPLPLPPPLPLPLPPYIPPALPSLASLPPSFLSQDCLQYRGQGELGLVATICKHFVFSARILQNWNSYVTSRQRLII